jgi:hypothetical protein
MSGENAKYNPLVPQVSAKHRALVLLQYVFGVLALQDKYQGSTHVLI